MSKYLNRFAIPFVSLKEGRHLFSFDIKDKFFENFEVSEINQGNLLASVELDKQFHMLTLRINVTGTVMATCDVCLDLVELHLNTENTVFVKFGDAYEELTDDTIIIPRQSSEINVAQLIYEFIHLALPIKKVHPDDNEGNPTCNIEMLQRLESLTPDTPENTTWDILKNLNTN